LREGSPDLRYVESAAESVSRVLQRGALVVLDGLVSTVAALIAVRREPAISGYLVASHRGTEPAHAALLAALGLRPLLELDLRLGEGSGAVLAVGLVRAACAVMREVRTYEEANVSRPEQDVTPTTPRVP
jgi:nicotinate-nucleotide--dimethylbenzimidazole phosphoribosyltransferase